MVVEEIAHVFECVHQCQNGPFIYRFLKWAIFVLRATTLPQILKMTKWPIEKGENKWAILASLCISLCSIILTAILAHFGHPL